MADPPTVTRRQVLHGLVAVAGLLGATAATSKPTPPDRDLAVQSATPPAYSPLVGVL